MPEERKPAKPNKPISIYVPRGDTLLRRAIKARAEQLYGRGEYGSVSRYVIMLIRQNLMENGLMKQNMTIEEELIKVEEKIAKDWSIRD